MVLVTGPTGSGKTSTLYSSIARLNAPAVNIMTAEDPVEFNLPAETGHLTLATLHTGSAVQTINRIVDMFPAGQQQQVRSQLAAVLEGLVCQTLVPAADGAGRVAATEVMVATPAIRNLIREGKNQQVYSALQTGQDRLGMQTLNQSLAARVGQGRIALADALARSSNRDELQEIVRRSRAAAATGRRWPAPDAPGRAR